MLLHPRILFLISVSCILVGFFLSACGGGGGGNTLLEAQSLGLWGNFIELSGSCDQSDNQIYRNLSNVSNQTRNTLKIDGSGFRIDAIAENCRITIPAKLTLITDSKIGISFSYRDITLQTSCILTGPLDEQPKNFSYIFNGQILRLTSFNDSGKETGCKVFEKEDGIITDTAFEALELEARLISQGLSGSMRQKAALCSDPDSTILSSVDFSPARSFSIGGTTFSIIDSQNGCSRMYTLIASDVSKSEITFNAVWTVPSGAPVGCTGGSASGLKTSYSWVQDQHNFLRFTFLDQCNVFYRNITGQ